MTDTLVQAIFAEFCRPAAYQFGDIDSIALGTGTVNLRIR